MKVLRWRQLEVSLLSTVVEFDGKWSGDQGRRNWDERESVEMKVVHGVCHEHEHECRQKSVVIKLMSLKVRVMEAAAVMAAIVNDDDEH